MMRRMGFMMLVAAAASGLMRDAASAADHGQPYTNAALPAAYDWTGFYAGVYSAGVRVGYNRQFGTFVLGAEADAGHLGGPTADIGDGGTLKQTWNSGARFRAGVAMDRTLIYGLVGYNVVQFKAGGTVTSGNKWKSGYDFGAGIEYALLKNISIGLEYDYSRFDNVTSVIGGTTKKNNFGDHTVRAGVNFRF
jgi:outer membrane immunogenic protein